MSADSTSPRSSSTRTLFCLTILFFLLGVFLFARNAPPVYAAALLVDKIFGADSGNCVGTPCKTIAYAISQASDGDSITIIAHIYPDVYTENLTIDKSLLFIGYIDPSYIIIDGNGSVTSQRVITVTAGVTVTMLGLTVRNGSAGSNPGGGIYNNGGNLNLYYTIVSGNSGQSGGGINNALGSTLTMISSTVKSNSGHFGGGIYSRGAMTITDSAISGNSANAGTSSEAGGLRIDDSGILTLTNVTISGNASNTGGGGIINNGGTVSLNNVTIAANIADADNSGTGDGGGIWDASGTINMKNTIIAGNIDRNGIAPDLFCPGVPPTSQGYNLIGNNKFCTSFTPLSSDQVGTNASPIDPKLGALASNGGSAQTHALLVGSPAINNGNPAAPGSGGNACALTDQRGVTRPVGSNCDIGAFEGTVYPLYLPLIMK